MSADFVRVARWRAHTDLLLPSDSAEFLTPRMAEYFQAPASEIMANPVCSYGDGSGAVLSFSAPPAGGVACQGRGRADHVFVSVVSSGSGPRGHTLDSVREEYDHPGVRVVPLSTSSWTYAYSVVVDADSKFIGGAVTRFTKVDGGMTLAVAFSGVNGPLDHDETHRVADDILRGVGWADGLSLDRALV